MTPTYIALIVTAYVFVINLTGFTAFYADKHAAVRAERRTPETILLFIALVGGSLGSIYAQHKFRHKTQKQPFKFQLYSIAILHFVLIMALCFPSLRQDIAALVKAAYLSFR